jgi:hypothetical protein
VASRTPDGGLVNADQFLQFLNSILLSGVSYSLKCNHEVNSGKGDAASSADRVKCVQMNWFGPQQRALKIPGLVEKTQS